MLFFNLAVMAFHSGQYKSCLQFLDSIPAGKGKLSISAGFLRIEPCLLLSQVN